MAQEVAAKVHVRMQIQMRMLSHQNGELQAKCKECELRLLFAETNCKSQEIQIRALQDETYMLKDAIFGFQNNVFPISGHLGDSTDTYTNLSHSYFSSKSVDSQQELNKQESVSRSVLNGSLKEFDLQPHVPLDWHLASKSEALNYRRRDPGNPNPEVACVNGTRTSMQPSKPDVQQSVGEKNIVALCSNEPVGAMSQRTTAASDASMKTMQSDIHTSNICEGVFLEYPVKVVSAHAPTLSDMLKAEPLTSEALCLFIRDIAKEQDTEDLPRMVSQDLSGMSPSASPHPTEFSDSRKVFFASHTL